ncbi:MAG: DUF2163 domain-containing protein [Alphaproteobacteria bacterium]|nr:DUF2163 domain-containing protein [Alphaproteobacteria bacterium]
MKQISSELAAHIAGEVTTLATCWKLTRRDGTQLGFTDHDNDFVFDSLNYQAETGFTPSAISNTSSLSVDNLDVEGMLSAGSITEADILAGLYDFAEIEIFQVNYQDVSQGSLKLRRGWLGEVSLHKQQFVAEVRGLTQRLSQTVGELFSPSCRAALGDSHCKVNMATHTVTGTISTATSVQEFIDNSRTEASATFAFGVVTFTSGANAGLSMEVKEHLRLPSGHGQFTLALPMPYPLLVGDAYSMTQGCDKTLATCGTRFGNVVNFRGEPYVPGLDKILETAGTRSNW